VLDSFYLRILIKLLCINIGCNYSTSSSKMLSYVVMTSVMLGFFDLLCFLCCSVETL
jgi:hypothetical protein